MKINLRQLWLVAVVILYSHSNKASAFLDAIEDPSNVIDIEEHYYYYYTDKDPNIPSFAPTIRTNYPTLHQTLKPSSYHITWSIATSLTTIFTYLDIVIFISLLIFFLAFLVYSFLKTQYGFFKGKFEYLPYTVRKHKGHLCLYINIFDLFLNITQVTHFKCACILKWTSQAL